MNPLLIIIIAFSVINTTTTQQVYSHKVFEDDPDLYIFSWRVLDDSKLEITMDCRTTGWIGFGVSKYGFMRNSDIILAYVDEKNQVVAFDMYADDYFKPLVDLERNGKSNIEVVSGTKADGRTKITLIRPMNNGDTYDLKIGKGEAINVIFAYKAGSTSLTQHTDMARHRLILWPSSNTTKVDLIDTSYRTDNSQLQMRVRFNNFEVPIQKNTNYYCKMFKIKEAIAEATGLQNDTTYHLTAFEPILIGDPTIVHHMLIYSCDLQTIFRDDYFECQDMIPGCTSIVTLQGLGSGPFVYPPEVGAVWGTYETSIVVLQTHYELPANFNGNPVKDSSGFDLYFTTKLRTYDAGVMMLGPPQDILKIPPKQESFYVVDRCICLGDTLKDKEMTIFAYVLHGHKILSKIQSVINYSNGTEDKSIEYLQYDFNKQALVQMQNPIKVKKGDAISTECWFNSMDKSKDTIGGFASDEEMCYSFVLYYPSGFAPNYCTQYLDCEATQEIARVESKIPLDRKKMKFTGNFDPAILPSGNGIVVKGFGNNNSATSYCGVLVLLFIISLILF